MLIGLTGGVATGKSTIAIEMARMGAEIIDADAIAREVLRPGEAVYEAVVTAFGPGVVLPSGEIDRKALGAMIFGNEDSAKRLNALTHPEIIQRMEARARDISASDPSRVIVYNAPLLFEAGLDKDVDVIVVVSAPLEAQIERLARRDNLSRESALARIRSQMELSKKVALADHVIENDGTLDELIARARAVYAIIAGECHAERH